MKIPNMHFLKKRTTGHKTVFRDPGHENGHKPNPDGTIHCCKRIMMLYSKNLVNLTCVEFLED